MSGLRIVFMGTPDFSVPGLQALLDAGHEVIAVYTQPPRKAGRGQKPQLSPVHQLAEEHDIPVFTPANFKNLKDRTTFAGLGADMAVVIAYGLILPRDILLAPKLGCINVHASLLPRWRGAAPIQRAIMHGDEETGVAIMRMDAGLDTGPVYRSASIAIDEEMTAGRLHDALAELGAKLLVETLPAIADGSLRARPQSGAAVSYANKIDKQEARIEWSQPAEMIERMVRGLSPFPGAYFEVNKYRVKILLAEVVPEAAGEPGQVLDERLLIACGRGAIRPLRLQRAGRGAMDLDDFLRGFKIEPGLVIP